MRTSIRFNNMSQCLPARTHRQLMAVIAGVTAAALGYMLAFSLRVFTVSSGSMSPTFTEGEHIVTITANAEKFFGLTYRRGDVVVLNSRSEHGRALKRVVAIAGDRAHITHGTLWVNNKTVYEPYAVHDNFFLRSMDEWPSSFNSAGAGVVDVEVPEGRVIVLGDNRSVSQDSRVWGAIPVSDIVGKVVCATP